MLNPSFRYIAQFDASDCGAACLAMVASAHGSRWSLAKVRDIAGTDRRGTNLNGMVIAAEALGFDAKALKSEGKALEKDTPVPFIAHLERDEGRSNHYVVVWRIGSGWIRVADPDPEKKRHRIRKEDFDKEWSGYSVFLNPTPEFKPSLETQGKLSRFLPLFRPHLVTIAQSVVASLVLTVLGLLGAFYFSYLVDEVLPSKAETSLHILSLGIVVLTLFQVALGVIRNQMLLHFSMKTALALNFSYLKHVFRQPLKFFDSRRVGEILSRLEDGAKIRGILSSVALSVVMDVFMMLIAAVFLLAQNSFLFLIAVATVPLSTAILWSFARFFRENYRRTMSQNADSQSFIVEALGGMATIKGLNASDRVFDEVEKRIITVTKTGYQGAVMGNLQGFLVGLIDGWGGNILFWIGSYLILKDQMTLGSLMAFNTLLGYFLGPLKRLLGLQTAIQEALVAADRLGEILELPPEVDASKNLLRPEAFRGAFEVKSVSFRYGTKRPVLESLSLVIEPRSKVAFVGPSGCGKSTLVKLLLKFYGPESGDLLLDGTNLLDLDTAHLRSRIGYVPQEVFLFSGSIRENLCLHQPEASFEEVVEAAQRAQAHGFITDLPERYDTVLAERGASLSGGERQRLALARALLGRPDILVFDEATSNLDVITEKAVHETIRELANEGTTTVLVAHRLATVVACDKIFVMDKGRIVEEGNHFELVKRGGAYAKLWEYQKL